MGWGNWDKRVQMEKLLGHEIIEVQGLEQYSETVTLFTKEGKFWFEHSQDCCESVSLEDFTLMGEMTGVVMRAYESTDDATTENTGQQYLESGTWTFYRIETPRGSLFMRWLGTSNGYYSEGVDLYYEEGRNG